jgi:hypothetical protein
MTDPNLPGGKDRGSVGRRKVSAEQASDTTSRHPMSTWSIAGLSAFLAALVPVLLAVGAGFYSSVRQCNQDASDIEDQLTSTLLEIESRETRMNAVFNASAKVATDKLIGELVQIESGADGHYGDPRFKDQTLVSLVNQYNRLLRRVAFPQELPYPAGLNIDTQNIHPAIAILDVTGGDARAFAQDIDSDLKQIKQQQDWYEAYAPVHRCSVFLMLQSTASDSSEPWKLIRLVKRPSAGG